MIKTIFETTIAYFGVVTILSGTRQVIYTSLSVPPFYFHITVKQRITFLTSVLKVQFPGTLGPGFNASPKANLSLLLIVTGLNFKPTFILLI